MNQLSIILFILILPGILATIIVERLTIHKRINSFFFILYSILLGLLSYVLLQIFKHIFTFLKSLIYNKNISFSFLHVWEVISNSNSYNVNLSEVAWATIVAVILGFIVSAIIHHKIVNKIAKKLSVSSKYGDENLFYYFLNSPEIDWIYIRDKERELIYQGRVESYSENEKIHEMVLTDVIVYSYYNQDKLYTTPTIYICKDLGKLQIEQIPQENFQSEEEN
jgi:hypothetical protein